MPRFHDTEFDAGTQLKLEIFRGYIREWIPVFLTESRNSRKKIKTVNIFDFFAGPGYDSERTPGSPVIIVQELRRFCEQRDDLKSSKISGRLRFNDIDSAAIGRLKKEIAEIACPRGCCRVDYSALPFDEALQEYLPEMKRPDSANLVIADQCGVTNLTPPLLRKLADCNTTDLLFFVSSSVLRRFAEDPGFRSKLGIDLDALRNADPRIVHRLVCDGFRQHLQDASYGPVAQILFGTRIAFLTYRL